MGRPSEYTEEVADILCEEIASGAALYKLCLEREDLPAERTVYKWLGKHEEFVQKYAHARARQQDYEADHIIVIADTAEVADIARLRIDARKWRASKLAPKKYGDKLEVKNEHSGTVGIASTLSPLSEVIREFEPAPPDDKV